MSNNRWPCEFQFGPAGRAMAAGDYQFIAGWVCGQFAVGVTAEWCRAERERLTPPPCTTWSDASWRMWWKRRVEDAGVLACGGGGQELGSLWVTMHTGGTWYSTPEEMERLKVWPQEPQKDTTATPGIERTQTMPTPVDRVAARVSGHKSG